MNRIGLKAALLVIVASIASAVAWDGDAGVRNCTRCRGTSGQGYTVAPRLTRQRPASIESQIRSFRDHTRNIPFSKQYMWGAVAAIDPRGAHFARIPPKLANGGNSAQANTEDDAAAPVRKNSRPRQTIASPAME
jgi:cytochrome c553